MRLKKKLLRAALRLARPVYRPPWPRRFRRSPPRCPEGWTTGPPDFVIAGAQKSGTTWWNRLILAHPGVERLREIRKEIHHFDDFWATPFTEADAAAYHRFFPRPPGSLTGECTPEYMYYPWVPACLRRAAPETRLIVLLRDPIERFRSGVTWDLGRGAPRHPIIPMDAVHRGFYHAHLHRLLEHFPRDQLLILPFERCAADPVPELERTYRFLGLEPADYIPGALAQPANVTRTSKIQLPAEVRAVLVEIFEEEVRHLVRDFPEIDPALWPNFRHLASTP